MGVGAVLGVLVVFPISGHPTGALMIVMGTLGAVVCLSFWRYGKNL
jgi:hypothetical protein